MSDQRSTCMIRKLDRQIRIPGKWIEEIVKNKKDEYIFISDCANILRAKRVDLGKENDSSTFRYSIDFEYNPDDLEYEYDSDGKLIVKKR